jgi:hypothetical protein
MRYLPQADHHHLFHSPREWLTSIAGALTVATLTVVSASPQAPDKFQATCPLPFFVIQDHHSIDTICQNEGKPKPAEGAIAENEEQNRAKNDFCAIGTPANITRKTFENLQTATDALKASTAGSATPFTYGSHDTLPADRTRIRANDFYTTSDGDRVHEGTLVRTVGFLLHGAYSNTGTGEGVNCYVTGVANNDVHLAFVQTRAEAMKPKPDECKSITAEITPHFRPADWLMLSTLHKTKTKTAREKIVAVDLDRPLRITGQMMMDGSHTPCRNGTGSPKRISVWEIHPVYAIDVCKKKTVSGCRVGVNGDWQSFDQWLADQDEGGGS